MNAIKYAIWNMIMTNLFFLCTQLLLVISFSYQYAEKFYEIADQMYRNTTKFKDGKNFVLTKVHLIRIPKASSTSLSVISRRIVGCDPPGPCCRYSPWCLT